MAGDLLYYERRNVALIIRVSAVCRNRCACRQVTPDRFLSRSMIEHRAEEVRGNPFSVRNTLLVFGSSVSTRQEQAVKRKDPGLLGSFRAIHGSEATGGFEPPNEGFAGRQTHPPTPLFAIRSITTQVPPTQPQNFGMENLIRSLFDLGLDSSINSPD